MLVGPPRSSPVSHFWFLGRRPASRGGSPIVSPCAPARYGFQKLGMHRLEAIKKIGMGLIECDVFDTQREARMWEISENLHRNDLDRIQRAVHEAEWIKLDEQSSAEVGQVGPPRGGRQPNDQGIRRAARELPVPGDSEEAKRHRLRRDMAIASAGEGALEEARKAGFANNERALLEVAHASEDQRVAAISFRASPRAGSRRMVRSSRPVFDATSAVKATDNLSVATPCRIWPCRTCARASGCKAS